MFNIQPTEEVKAAQELAVMDSHSQFALSQLKEYTTHAWRAFWYGEASPVTKMELLGTQALDIFTMNTDVQAFIQSIDPTHVQLGIPAEYQITWNQDGSGVVSAAAPEP